MTKPRATLAELLERIRQAGPAGLYLSLGERTTIAPLLASGQIVKVEGAGFACYRMAP